jgi:hypothetical protein
MPISAVAAAVLLKRRLRVECPQRASISKPLPTIPHDDGEFRTGLSKSSGSGFHLSAISSPIRRAERLVAFLWQIRPFDRRAGLMAARPCSG